jgi:hypothetical protein
MARQDIPKLPLSNDKINLIEQNLPEIKRILGHQFISNGYKPFIQDLMHDAVSLLPIVVANEYKPELQTSNKFTFSKWAAHRCWCRVIDGLRKQYKSQGHHKSKKQTSSKRRRTLYDTVPRAVIFQDSGLSFVDQNDLMNGLISRIDKYFVPSIIGYRKSHSYLRRLQGSSERISDTTLFWTRI